MFSPEQKRLDPGRTIHYWYTIETISRLLRRTSPVRLLDFGCGAGGFLVQARTAGFDVMGLELSRDLAEHVRRAHGIPVHQGSPNDREFTGEGFDVIVASQVFEHLTDPRDTLQILHSRLGPQGLIVIEVPNARDLRERVSRGATMDDSHLFYFNRNSLTQLMATCDFRVVRIEEGLRPYRLLGNRARRLPICLLRAGERLTSLCQLKTSLTVIAAARGG